MLAVLRLRDGAYAVPITGEIRERTGRRTTRAAVYVTLQRLERKGLVESHLGDPLPERGGRPRRYVRVTAEGGRAVSEAKAAFTSMWAGVDPMEGLS